MSEETKAPSSDATDARQPTFIDALAELAKALGGGGRGVDRGRGGPTAKVTRAPRRSCCSGKR